MTMTSEYYNTTREYYNTLDVHTLRIMGREIGVEAPTRLKKAALIEQIILVENGVIEPHRAEQANKGRPPLECNLKLKNLDDLKNNKPQEPIRSYDEEAVERNFEKARMEQKTIANHHGINRSTIRGMTSSFFSE